MLPPDVHTALSQLLGALSSPDNTLRTQAEEQLNSDWIQNRPDVLLMGLAEQIQGAEDTVVSSFGLTQGERRGRQFLNLFTERQKCPPLVSNPCWFPFL